MLLRTETSFKFAFCNFIDLITASRQGDRREDRRPDARGSRRGSLNADSGVTGRLSALRRLSGLTETCLAFCR